MCLSDAIAAIKTRRAKEAERQSAQKQIRSRIEALLEQGHFEEADRTFHEHATEWWSSIDYQAARKRGVLRVEQAAEARRREVQQQLTENVRQLLRRGRIRQADVAYAKCLNFWPRHLYEEERASCRSAHESRIRERWDARLRRRQDRLRGEAVSLLQKLDIEGADRVYVDCRSWWPIAEFKALRAAAVRIKDFVDAYANASLADLDARYGDAPDGHLSADDYARLKIPKLKLRLARLGMPLDLDQLLACAHPEQHRLIRARAGSGKTRTLAALAALMIHDEALNPDQVLILAFNKKAANEIGDRVRGAAGIDEFRNARTFHSLAWQLADHAGRELVFDDGNLAPSRRKQTGFVERLIESIMNPAFRERLYGFFRRELEQLDQLGSNLPKEEYVAFRRAMADYTLGGQTVKSNGEKFIADFLFEHGIAYKYEKVWSWDKQDRLRGTAYRPDFSIINGGQDLILEHWAVDPADPSANVPDWWDTNTRDYLHQIEAKREFWAKRGVALLETHAGMLTGGREEFEKSLKVRLEGAGIPCRKLPHEELVRRVAEAPRTVSRMAELFLQFISRAKKRGWKVEDMSRIVRDAPDPEPRNRAFHELAVHAYAAYERKLVAQSALDFDDLLISAAECVQKDGDAARLQLDRKDSIAIRDLRWILIDEFQDFSELYYRVISAILEVNPSIRVVAVGDDWQAINGFTGAQLTFFNEFDEHFAGAGTATISKNRRSGRAIVGAGNQLMERHGEPALAHHDFDGDIDIVASDKVWVENGSAYAEIATSALIDGRKVVNWELARALKACVDYIAASVFTDSTQGLRWMPSVLILARTGRAYGKSLAGFGECLEQALHRHPDLQDLANDFAVADGRRKPVSDDAVLIEIMTAHKAKGKEAGTVIVLEAVLRQFPKVHADNQLFGPFGVTAEDVLAEERRLFYVAATRAENRLMFLTETGKESPYLGAMTEMRLAPRRSEDNDGRLGIVAQSIKMHLDQIDQESLIRQNVSQQAVVAWDRLAKQSLGPPVVGHSPHQNLYAELAWPEQVPPLAILTGRHSGQAAKWRQQGWQVHLP
jgi:DNA helicase-4